MPQRYGLGPQRFSKVLKQQYRKEFSSNEALVSAAISQASPTDYGIWMSLKKGSEEILLVRTRQTNKLWHGRQIKCFCICNVVVSEQHQRKGYYARFLAEVEKRARASGFDAVVVETVARQSQHDLYRRRNFVQHEHNDYIRTLTTDCWNYQKLVRECIKVAIKGITEGKEREVIATELVGLFQLPLYEETYQFVKSVQYCLSWDASPEVIYATLSRSSICLKPEDKQK